MSEELKPCPFCGGEAHIAERLTYGGKLYGACCYGTLCPGSEPFPWCLDYEDAADAWNRRAERTCRMVRARWDDGECVWGCRCTACGDRFTYETGTTWRYCPACGARVAREA